MLQTPTLRILYPKGVTQAEVDAVLKGVGRFSAFGLKCEAAMVGPKRGESIAARDVFSGEKLVDFITSDASEPLLLRVLDLHSETVMAAFRKKSVFGLAITDRPLIEMPETESEIAGKKIGIGYPKRGAIISIYALRTLPDDVRMEAMEIASAHEAGHVLNRQGHCKSAGCIMRGNERLDDFIQVFVRQTCDLCADCADKIRGFVSSVGCHSW